MTSANDTACIAHLIACRLMNVEWKMLINNNNNLFNSQIVILPHHFQFKRTNILIGNFIKIENNSKTSILFCCYCPCFGVNRLL